MLSIIKLTLRLWRCAPSTQCQI